MDIEELHHFSGALTAQRFLLENLWALLLAQHPDPLDALAHTRDEMLRQMEIPNPRSVASPETFVVLQHATDQMERFWRAVEDRLRSTKR